MTPTQALWKKDRKARWAFLSLLGGTARAVNLTENIQDSSFASKATKAQAQIAEDANRVLYISLQRDIAALKETKE